ncbi:MAG: hypothetical protein JXA21_09155 [Anaerolineae bacterium]|nr:hypothetical protein [Anaerolineae bacterium]
MRRAMRDVWLTVPEDVTPHMDNTPIDWKPFPAQAALDGQFVIRAVENTPGDLEGFAEVVRTGFPVIRDTEFDILFEASGFVMLLGAGDTFNRGEHLLIVAEEACTGKITALTLLSMAKKQRNAELVLITRTVEVFEQKFYHSAHQMATHELDLLPQARSLIVPW